MSEQSKLGADGLEVVKWICTTDNAHYAVFDKKTCRFCRPMCDADDAHRLLAQLRKELAQRDAEVERLKREANNDAIAYKAVIERQKEIREERDILQKQLDRFNSQSHGIPALSEIEKLRARLAALESQQAACAGASGYIECRECDECQHAGFNDAADGKAACHSCLWTGDDPEEDICPGCGSHNCMAAACPECGSRYVLVADTKTAALSPAGGGVGHDVATLQFALSELHKSGIKPGSLPHVVLTNLIDEAKPQANSQEGSK